MTTKELAKMMAATTDKLVEAQDRIAELEKLNALLAESVKVLAAIPIEKFETAGKRTSNGPGAHPDNLIVSWIMHVDKPPAEILVKDVIAARAALAAKEASNG